jgi:hypothetical protein
MKAIITNESKEQKALNDFLNEEIDNKIYLKDIHIASGEILQALVDKSIPMKVDRQVLHPHMNGIHDYSNVARCPKCGKPIAIHRDKYVHNDLDCLQVLDWSRE